MPKGKHNFWNRLAVIAALSAPNCLAQISEGTLVGAVRDSSGAVIPAAVVTVLNVRTNVSSASVTNSVGEYIFANLAPGEYTVTAKVTGFRTEIFRGLTLRAGTSSRVDFTLQPGDVQQEITVTSDAPLLQTENAAVGSNIPNQSVVELPLRGRMALDLALLEAGVLQPATGTSASRVEQLGGGSGKAVVISGVREHYNNYTLDGTTIYQSFSGYMGYSPSVEAIQEVRVDTSNNNARQGRVAGGTIAFTTRAGTNTLHGSVFEFLRNDKFDALNWGQPGPIPAYRFNQFGFMLAGPWYIPKVYNGKDRTFFMFNYEGVRVRRLGAGGAIVPTAAEKAGDFSGGKPVVDPVTGSPFPGNLIPSDRIHPIAAGILSYYPDPNTFDNPRFNYVSSGSQRDGVNQFNMRVDHRFSDKDSVFYSMAAQPSNSTPRQVLAGMGSQTTGDFFKHTISYNRMFSPAVLNNARFGIYDRSAAFFNLRAFREDVWTNVGLNRVAPRITIPAPNWGIPGVSIFGYDRVADSRGGETGEIQLDFYNDATWSRGRHVLQFGGMFLREHQNVNLTLLNLPSMAVDGRYTGSAMGDFLLGHLSSSSVTQGAFDPQARQNHYGFYFQDDFRASSRLTINIGLRYEYNSPATEVKNKLASWDPGRGKLVYPGEVSAGVLRPYRKDFSPRLGFAYRLTDKTVIRSAYGIYWNTEFSSQTENILNPPFVTTENFFGDPTVPNLTLDDPFPLGTGRTPFPNLNVRNTYMTDAYSQQWNFSVERTLPANSVGGISYVGNKGTHLPWFGHNPNATLPGPGDIQSRRPYPNFGPFGYVNSIGTSNYHALQARWERRYTAGLLFRAHYTWSKTIILGEDSLYGPGLGHSGTQDQRCLKCERGPALFDAPHRLALSYVWMIPSGGTRGVVGGVLGGWQFSGSTIFQSGAPYTIIAALARPNGDASVRPLVVGDPKVSQLTWERQFNTAAFATPPDFTLGNLGQRTQRMGGLNQFDLGLMKNFEITEIHRIQFRAEFYNAFNHPTFAMPDRALGSPRFGLVSSSLQRARNMQFGLKYMF